MSEELKSPESWEDNTKFITGWHKWIKENPQQLIEPMEVIYILARLEKAEELRWKLGYARSCIKIAKSYADKVDRMLFDGKLGPDLGIKMRQLANTLGIYLTGTRDQDNEIECKPKEEDKEINSRAE